MDIKEIEFFRKEAEELRWMLSEIADKANYVNFENEEVQEIHKTEEILKLMESN